MPSTASRPPSPSSRKSACATPARPSPRRPRSTISCGWCSPASGTPFPPCPGGKCAGIPSRTCWTPWLPGPTGPSTCWPTWAGAAGRTAPNCSCNSRRTATTGSTPTACRSGSTRCCSAARSLSPTPPCWWTASACPARWRRTRARACLPRSRMPSIAATGVSPWPARTAPCGSSATVSSWTALPSANRTSTCSASIPRLAPVRPAAASAKSSGSARTSWSRTRPRASTTAPSPAGAARRWVGSRTALSRWQTVTASLFSNLTATCPGR